MAGTFGLSPIVESWTYGCSHFLFFWGSFDRTHSASANDTHPPELFVSALGCNETLEVVDVDITFFGSELRIDPLFPPVVREDTVRVPPILQPPNDSDHASFMNWAIGVWDQLVAPSSEPLLDRFFDTLTTSPLWSVPPSYLANAEHAAEVGDAIKAQMLLGISQTVNLVQRLPAAETNVTLLKIDAETPDDARVYKATVTDPLGRRRVVQDAAATRAIQGLLAAAVLCSLAGWVLMPGRVLPREPTSIASVGAMVADGNLRDFLPPGSGAEWITDEGLRRWFPPGAAFWLGSRNVPGVGERFGIWVLDMSVSPGPGTREK